jgi:prepilin-type N-terminal cleavage/methylation domain-containing protein/prepilin-type processing-associated H-X9-DG protein
VNKKAFTLIELLVVISIIALLLSILMPSLSRVKELARKVVCKSQMRQIGMASISYAAENNDAFPQSIGASNPTSGVWPGDPSDLSGMSEEEKTVYVALNATWWGLIGPYTNLETGKMDSVERLREMSLGTIGNCPSHGSRGNQHTEGGKDNFSYHGNGNMFQMWIEYVPGQGVKKIKPTYTSLVRFPAQKILCFELFMQSDWPLAYDQSSWRGRPHPDFLGQIGTQHSYSPGNTNDGWTATHGNDLNYAFTDGHVESVDHMVRMGESYFKTNTSPDDER